MILGVGLLAAACGGDGDDERSAERTPTTAEPTTTTAAEHRIDVYQPIPGGSLHGTPRPPLENAGDDYVAITESLIANFRWLTENPDPRVVSELFVPGTQLHDQHVTITSTLSERGWHAADDAYRVLSISPESSGDATTVRVVEQFGSERIVDSSNAVLETIPHGAPREAVVVLVRDRDGRVRIADWSTITDVVVEP